MGRRKKSDIEAEVDIDETSEEASDAVEKPKKVKVSKEDANAAKFANDLADFLESNTGIRAVSLKHGGNVPYWLNTGSYALNWIISNDFFSGFPGSRISLISGEEGKGKSFLLDVMLGHNIEMGGASFKVMIEAAANYDFSVHIVGSEEIAEKIHIIKAHPDAKGKVDPITVEKLTSIIYKIIDYQMAKKENKNKSIVIGVDSVTQLTSEKEMEGVEKRANGKADKKDMTSAVKMRELFRAIEQKIEHANVTIIGLGQLTANISTGWVPPGTPKSSVNVKGSGFKYASSLTVQMVSDKEIKDAKTNTPVGIKMKLKTIKNRIQFKGRDCYLYFYFRRGVDPFGGLVDLLGKYGVIDPIVQKKNAKGEIKDVTIKPEVNGEFKPEALFKYDGKYFTRFNVAKFVEAEGGEELLKKWNTELNAIYEKILEEAGITEEDYLASEELEDEEGNLMVEQEEGEESSEGEE